MSTTHAHRSLRRSLSDALCARRSVFTFGALAALSLGITGCPTTPTDPCDGFTHVNDADLALTPYWRQCTVVEDIEWRDANNNLVPVSEVIKNANEMHRFENMVECFDGGSQGTQDANAWCVQQCQSHTPPGLTDNCADPYLIKSESGLEWVEQLPTSAGDICTSWYYVQECGSSPVSTHTVTCGINDPNNMLGIGDHANFVPNTLCGQGSHPSSGFEFCVTTQNGGAYTFDTTVYSDESEEEACQDECEVQAANLWTQLCSNCVSRVDNCDGVVPLPARNGAQADPDGGDFIWITSAGRVTAPLACDLNQTCCESFAAPACKNLQYGRVFDAAATSTAQLSVAALLDINGTETRADLSGEVTYSVASCTNSAGTCPIYIESIALEGSDPITGAWGNGTAPSVTFSVSSPRLTLLKPALGARYTSTGQVNIAADALQLRFDGDFTTSDQSLTGPLSSAVTPQSVLSGSISSSGAVTLYGGAELAPGVWLSFEAQGQ